MKNSDLFYRCYDDLYFSKNYSEETALVVSLVRKNYPGKIKKALEIGTGTGNHAVELAKNDFSIVSVDTDKKMLSAAKRKISGAKLLNVKLVHGRVEDLKEKTFDFSVAGFNVINYLKDFDSLKSFFKAVCVRLKPDGLLIFDCWNGVAAIKDPPKTKIIHGKSRKGFIHCTISSKTNFMRQKTRLTYSLSLRNETGDEMESGVFSFEQMLWTPMEISWCARNAGLEIIKCSRHFQPETDASEDDWKIFYICQKRS